ncbi:bud site selection protein [Vanrija albida]|uniref:Bud site selection protein n=1 Tax=Vanrija albida TaxID=181172 RepID=A0ABR3QFR9_9TREE
MSELFKDIPEFVETDIGESVIARTETLASFRELGPPDLCHVVKSYGQKAAQKDIGSYHYCSGVEASSSASVAAYFNSLQFHVEESPAWFGKGSGWRVRTGTYCCFNAFSRVDVRVDVRIPGGVDAYVVDLRGDRHEATPEIWQETYLSAMLRAIRYADDASYRLAGYRKLDIITTVEQEERFLKAAEELFFQGWQLGSDPEVQVATNISNHLTAGLLKYFSDSYRLERAANLFERLYAKEPEVAALLAQSYIGMNEEIKAVQIMNQALAKLPKSYPILLAQVDFLLSKGKAEWARQVAQQAVNSAPSEFLTWAKLAEAHIQLGQYDKALLTLNSCPMFTFNERDLHRMPTPARTHLPVLKYIADSGIIDEESARDNEADVALLRLPAPGLRGTFAKAYSLLALLVSKISWDELLKTRSAVFVMEEEYRQHKTSASVDVGSLSTHGENGDKGDANGHADEDASTRGLHSRPGSAPPSDGVPTIRVSTESERHGANGNGSDSDGDDEKDDEPEGEPEALPQKPKTLVHAPEDKDKAHDQAITAEAYEGSAFANKRLCERWLDNLFLVLYDDLRVYTIWRAEISHFQMQHMSYRKTGTEWEILGELALRLHHKDEAKDAFVRCLDAKFSAKALLRVLEIYSDEGDLQRTLNAAIKLTVYHNRWYMGACYPSAIAHAIYKLGLTHGLSKIEYTLLSMNLPEGVFPLMAQYIKYAKTFNVEGSEY